MYKQRKTESLVYHRNNFLDSCERCNRENVNLSSQFFQAAGEDPDFEHEDYVYAVVCGVFVPSIADIPLIVDKMKEVVPYTNCRYVNLTDKHNLEKVSGKSSYAFCLEYEYSSDTAKGM